MKPGSATPGSGAGVPFSEQLPVPGDVIQGRYRIERQLGRGATGAVFAARSADGEEVALKVQLRDSAESLARFEVEAAALAKLRHPGIVAVRDFGQTERGNAFLAMELVPGTSLAEILKAQGALESAFALDLTLQLARALAHAHEAGVLHRDLKPENVLVTPRRRAVLGDFGLAKIVDQNQHLSTTGQLLGTPAYMAPEQASGQVHQVSPATEVYGLGATLYDMLSGRPPFVGMGSYQLLVAVFSVVPEPPSAHREGIDPRLEAICMRCLAKDPAARYPGMPALIADLEACAASLGRGSASRTGPALVAAFAGVAILLTFAVLVGLEVSGQGEGASSPSPRLAPSLSAWVPQLRWGDSERRQPEIYLWLDQELLLTLEAQAPVAVVVGGVVASREAIAGQSVLELPTRGGSPVLLVPAWKGTLDPGQPQSVTLAAREVEALGLTEWVAVAVDVDGYVWGRPLPLALRLPPKWLLELPPAARPLGLPAGLEALSTPGEFRNASDGSTLVWIPAGGTTLFEGRDRLAVQLATGVFMGKHEVTRAQFARYRESLGLAGEAVPAGLGQQSVSVGWFGAQAYCRWAGARLPHEAEWARAAWGEETSPKRATLGYVKREQQPTTGDTGSPSPFGCMDMLGNLREYTLDSRHDLDEPVPTKTELSRGDIGAVVVVGGSWLHPPRRRHTRLVSRRYPTGFRICVDPLGRTRDLSSQAWVVQLGRFKPRKSHAADEPWLQAPRPDEITPLTDRAWVLSSLVEPWPFTETCQRAGLGTFLEGLYFRATTTLPQRSGAWIVAVLSDDGVRVRLREGSARPVLLIDRWTNHPSTFDRARFVVSGAAPVLLEVDYCNIGGGRELRMSLVPVPD
ncbi:MAG: protein kinase [Planctomycetes bacterium]|nr:protein kinase [Planctomycetota bacterium]